MKSKIPFGASFVTLLLFSILTAPTASAAIIGTFNSGNFVQSGSITNSYSSAITDIIIDFVVDAGGNTAVWDINGGTTDGNPVATFTNGVAGSTRYFFTAAWSGLNIAAAGGVFAYSNMDYDGWDNPGFNSGGGTPLDGSETITLVYANGASVFANLPAINPRSGFLISFDDSNLTNGVPEPSIIALFVLGILGLGFARRRKYN